MAKERTPRTRGAGTMTESGFFGFIRSGLRAKHARWKPRAMALKAASREIPPERRVGRQRLEVCCNNCRDWFSLKEVEVDHLIPAGKLRTFDDLPGFVERLFCEEDGYQILCKECHALVTLGERNSV